jgi:fused signal recognition particle receptor
MGWFNKLRSLFGSARQTSAQTPELAIAGRPLDQPFWEELEEILLAADFGMPTTEKIIDGLRVVAGQQLWNRSDEVVDRFKSDVRAFLTLPDAGLALRSKPAVVLVVGVNGSGKTTTIGKLAYLLRSQGKRVTVIAADTFRAAAAEQLGVWAERAGAELVRGNPGADPSSVVYDGLVAAKARGADVAIIDTAGRLQTKTNLMEELKKMRRVAERETGGPLDETLLVVDGTTGQNAISQGKLFHEATTLTGVVVTKLDSTAKGGVLVAIVDTLVVPIKFIGVGESIDALRPFDPVAFTEVLFESVPADEKRDG